MSKSNGHSPNGHKRAVLYVRVSTDEQAERGYSLQSQLEACRKYAAQNGYTVVAELSDDYSGAKLDRPGLDAVRGMTDRRETAAVIVYTADRLSRNLAHSLIIREEWRQAGIELHYADRGQAQDTAEGRLTQNVEAVIAEYEREKIRERTRRGRIAKAKAGKWVGAGNVPYGYRKIGKGPEANLEIHGREAAVVRRIFDLFNGANGGKPLSVDSIAAMLTDEAVPPPNRGQGHARGWWKFTVNRILRRRAYIGEFLFCGHTIHLPELAFVERDIWDSAQRRMVTNKERAKRNRKHDYLLTGHLKCTCGRSLSGKLGGSRRSYTYYACRNAIDWHFQKCREAMIQSAAADAAVWGWVYGLTDDARLETGIRQWRKRSSAETVAQRKRLALLDSLIDKAQRKINRLAADYAEALEEEDEGRAEALKDQMKIAGRQRDALDAEHETLTAQLAQVELSPAKEARVREILKAIRARIDGATIEQKREILDLLDFRGQLEYRDGRRGLNCTCHLRIKPDFVDIAECSSPSSSRPTTRRSACRPLSQP